MNIGAMLGGDWGGGFAQGMQMAVQEKQLAMQQQRMKQEEQRNRMLMEEHMLKLKRQRQVDEAGEKLKQSFSPQTTTKTEMTDPSDPSFGMGTPIEKTTTTTQEPRLISELRRTRGDKFADAVMMMAQVNPAKALEMAVAKPNYQAIGESGLLNTDTGEVIKGTPKQKFMNVPEGGTLIDPNTKEVVYQSPKNPQAKTPTGFRFKDDGSMEPIPGGPADIKGQNAASQAFASRNNANESLNRLQQAANELMTHKGLGRITGIMGKLPNVPGSDAANAQALLDNLKSQAGFTVLQNMRDMSKTGGALGQVSDFENKMLQANLAALDNAQSLPEFKKALKKIVDYTESAKGRINNAYDQSYYGKRGPSTGNPNPPVPGARQAPNGNWYVPDPKRPGQYLQVVE